MEHTPVSPAELAGLEGLDDWRVVLGRLHTTFRAGGSFASAGDLAKAIAARADEVDHHPDLDLRYPDVVHVAMATHDAGSLTTKDVDLARDITALAAAAGAASEPQSTQCHEIAIDTMDADRIRPFWAAVLGYVEEPGGGLHDPRRMGPPLWFQRMDEPRTHRDRFHIDVSVPHDVAEARVAAALAAGGRLVTDEHARAWWVLADADGNEACVSTWQDRGGA